METSPSPTALPSPTSHSSSCSSSSDNNGLLHSLPSPKTPTISSSSNPYPTTFVQADTSSFKQVVQMLTGTPTSPTSSHNVNNNNNIPPIRSSNKSKLYERRNSSLKALKMIHPLAEAGARAGAGTTGTFSPSQAHQQYSILSPSMLDFPALALSPVTPLIPDPFNRSPIIIDQKAEEMAIKEKGFYFHPVAVSSPVSNNTPRDSEPRLLPLFPLTSPKASSGSH